MDKMNTFIIPVIRTDLIARCLETLYKYTDSNFYVIIIDQSIGGVDPALRDKYEDLMIVRTPRTMIHKGGNFGFAKATNLGASLVTTPYMTFCNDDVEFINRKWWNAVMATFDQVDTATPDRPCIMVNPSSIKLPDWSVGRKEGDDFFIMPYKKDYTEDDWDHLVHDEHYVNQHLTLQPKSVIDGVTLYCSVIDTKKFLTVGPLDESYYPGGAEDYDYCCRASLFGYRCVGTTSSWVFHHWSSTFASIKESEDICATIDDPLRFGDHNKIWGPRFDIWGVKCDFAGGCSERMRTIDGFTARCPIHPDITFEIPEAKFLPL